MNSILGRLTFNHVGNNQENNHATDAMFPLQRTPLRPPIASSTTLCAYTAVDMA